MTLTAANWIWIPQSFHGNIYQTWKFTDLIDGRSRIPLQESSNLVSRQNSCSGAILISSNVKIFFSQPTSPRFRKTNNSITCITVKSVFFSQVCGLSVATPATGGSSYAPGVYLSILPDGLNGCSSTSSTHLLLREPRREVPRKTL